MKKRACCSLVFAALVVFSGCDSSQASKTPSPEKKGYVLTEREKSIFKTLLIDEIKTVAVEGDGYSELVKKIVGDYVVTTSDKLQKAYEKNEVAGDQAFRNKTIFVNGIVRSIDRGIGENYFISLKGGSNPFMQPKASMVDGYTTFLASLEKGTKVFLLCKGNGMLMGSAMLSNCEPLLNFASKLSQKYVGKINAGEAISNLDASSRIELKLFVVSVAVATSLPDSSTCFVSDGNGEKCLADIKEVLDSKNKAKRDAFKSALQSSGKRIGVDFDALQASF